MGGHYTTLKRFFLQKHWEWQSETRRGTYEFVEVEDAVMQEGVVSLLTQWHDTDTVDKLNERRHCVERVEWLARQSLLVREHWKTGKNSPDQSCESHATMRNMSNHAENVLQCGTMTSKEGKMLLNHWVIYQKAVDHPFNKTESDQIGELSLLAICRLINKINWISWLDSRAACSW